MRASRPTGRHTRSRWLAAGGLVGAAALTLAACGKSASTAASTPPTSAAAGGITIGSASVPGVGAVLVNGQGMTLYLLTSEKGGKLTCTDANGCTKVWPDTELPAGVTSATAGTGVDATKLGTIKGASGSLYVTYAGWPLYTFSGDSATGQAHGEGIVSFGGTWETLTPAGTPVTPTASPTSSTTAYSYGN